MKLFTCLDMADSCGLQTISEALYNIEIHAPSLFSYTKINEELEEVYNEIKDRNISMNITIQEGLDIINYQDHTNLQFFY